MQAFDAQPQTLTRYRLTTDGERAISEAEVDRMAELIWTRARRSALIAALQRMNAAPLAQELDRELYGARADALLALDRRIVELERGL